MAWSPCRSRQISFKGSSLAEWFESGDIVRPVRSIEAGLIRAYYGHTNCVTRCTGQIYSQLELFDILNLHYPNLGFRKEENNLISSFLPLDSPNLCSNSVTVLLTILQWHSQVDCFFGDFSRIIWLFYIRLGSSNFESKMLLQFAKTKMKIELFEKVWTKFLRTIKEQKKVSLTRKKNPLSFVELIILIDSKNRHIVLEPNYKLPKKRERSVFWFGQSNLRNQFPRIGWEESKIKIFINSIREWKI